MKYTKEKLAQAVSKTDTYAGVLRELGLKQAGGTYAHISSRIKYFGIDTSHFKGQGWARGKESFRRKPPEEVLILMEEGSTKAKTRQLHRSLLSIGREYKCELCDLTDNWNGNKLTLHIDHIDGNWLDNRQENLRFLCPNCHSQTETYGSGKVKK